MGQVRCKSDLFEHAAAGLALLQEHVELTECLQRTRLRRANSSATAR
jgi:hypothetical protein